MLLQSARDAVSRSLKVSSATADLSISPCPSRPSVDIARGWRVLLGGSIRPLWPDCRRFLSLWRHERLKNNSRAHAAACPHRRFQHARIGAGLNKHFAQHRQVEAQCRPQSQTFCQGRRIGVHHHIHEGFYVGGFTGRTDIAEMRAQRFQGGAARSKTSRRPPHMR